VNLAGLDLKLAEQALASGDEHGTRFGELRIPEFELIGAGVASARRLSRALRWAEHFLKRVEGFTVICVSLAECDVHIAAALGGWAFRSKRGLAAGTSRRSPARSGPSRGAARRSRGVFDEFALSALLSAPSIQRDLDPVERLVGADDFRADLGEREQIGSAYQLINWRSDVV